MSYRTQENPDYVVSVTAADRQSVGVGFGYKSRRGAMRVFFNDDPRSRQLLFEAGEIELHPFRTSKRHK